MNLIIDGIIYSLQRTGGISVVWNELLYRYLSYGEITDLSLLAYDNSDNNIHFRQISDLLKERTRRFRLSALSRYSSVDCNSYENGKFLFHSSYYRTCKNKNAINITTVHDFTYEYYAPFFKRVVHSLQKRNAINHSKGIICISQNTKDDLIKFYPNIPEDKIRVIYNGVSNEYRVLENSQCKFAKNSFVLYVGSRVGYKNFTLAALAAAKLNLDLVVIGSQLTRSEYNQLRNIFVKKSFYVESSVSNEILNIYYNHAFCLVYPSSYEGFGIPVIEAQKAGCPVIAYNGSSIPEIIGYTELLFDSLSVSAITDQMMKLECPSFRKKVISLGLSNSQRFNWNNTVKEYMNFYKYIFDLND